MSDSIAIINYGMGNLHSIHNMLKHLNIPAIISSDPKTIQHAKKLILPGVGAFDTAVNKLKDLALWDSIHVAVTQKQIPILGICLGMQLMTKKSEEGELCGFGWIDAETKKLPLHKQYKVPHIGWNKVSPFKLNDFFVNYNEQLKFYFIHSYFVDCYQAEDVMAITEHGQAFTAAFQKNNMIGVQFHPEKSHRYGMAFIKYFADHFIHE